MSATALDGDRLRESIEAHYPGRLALLLVRLCDPRRAHQHRVKNTMVDCTQLGKRPLDKGWNATAVERWKAGEGRDKHVDEMVRHLGAGGNIGWAVPPGVLVIDCDTPAAVEFAMAMLTDAAIQESRPGRCHAVVRVPADLEIDATVRHEIAPGIDADLRTAGRSQIAVAPARHASGTNYRWIRSLPADVANLPWCPPEILDRMANGEKNEEPARRTGAAKIIAGGRNDYLFRHGCAMRSRGATEAEIRVELEAENDRRCAPPLDADEVASIVDSVLRYRAGAGEGDPRRFFAESGLVVPRLGDEIRALGHVTPGIDGRLYHYRGGVYRGDGETFIRGAARRLLIDLYKRRHVDEVFSYLRSFEGAVSDRQPDGLINVCNGLLEWNAETPTLHTHAPEIVSTLQLPHEWNPEAHCPRIDRFLATVVPDATEFVIEVVGYALMAGNPLRVAVLLLGPGRNGKSVLLAIIKALLGAENVSVVPLQVLTENRFAAAELFGKLANICGDLDARAIRQTDSFKMLTGGDPMLAERKHRDHFQFVPFALPLFSANEPPLSSDQTEAWFDRWIVVPMQRRIPESEIDPHLIEKLTTPGELAGLLVRAVEGLRRLMARGRFDLPESVKQARLAYRERLDSAAGFMAEECSLAPDAWTPRTRLYKAYQRWTQESNRLPVSAAAFYDKVRSRFPEQVEDRARNGVRGFAGIWLREGAQDE